MYYIELKNSSCNEKNGKYGEEKKNKKGAQNLLNWKKKSDLSENEIKKLK